MQGSSTWREILEKILQDTQEKQRLAKVLEVHPITLLRWVHSTTKPRAKAIQQLLAALPEHRVILLEAMREEFPELSFSSEDNATANRAAEIPSGFYVRVLDAYATTPHPQYFWSLANLILQQAIGQIDPLHSGMALTLIQCMPPTSGRTVRSLRERMGRGTPPWDTTLDQHAIFLGAESLAGFAVSSGRVAIIQSPKELSTFPAHWTEWEQSAAAYPLMRTDAIAGCLLASANKPHAFSLFHETLLHDYAQLLLLLFNPEDFYRIGDIALQPMPSYTQQKAYLSNYRQRLADVQREAIRAQRHVSLLDAELIVWQQMEQELLDISAA